jgi:hypothetical protein
MGNWEKCSKDETAHVVFPPGVGQGLKGPYHQIYNGLKVALLDRPWLGFQAQAI